MSLLGEGALVIWHDIAAGCESDYNEWHSKEHMLERVAVAGFRRGHRYQARSGSPKFLNLYEVETLATLTSQPYLERLNHPTPWSRKAMGYIRNNNRTLCRVVASVGNGICAEFLTIQLAGAPGRSGALGRWLTQAIPALAERPGVLGALSGRRPYSEPHRDRGKTAARGQRCDRRSGDPGRRLRRRRARRGAPHRVGIGGAGGAGCRRDAASRHLSLPPLHHRGRHRDLTRTMTAD
jgi:hypothetical protein